MDRKDVKNEWNKVSKTYSESRKPNGPETQLIEELIDSFNQTPKILDIGCGDGKRTLKNLTESSIGIDISVEGLKLATQNVENDLVQSDMVKLPFKDDSFDAITAYFAVFHVKRENHDRVYDEFSRVLRPSGRLLMTLPSGSFENVRHGWMSGKMLFSSPGRNQTLELLENAGLANFETTTSNDPLGGSTEFVIAGQR